MTALVGCGTIDRPAPPDQASTPAGGPEESPKKTAHPQASTIDAVPDEDAPATPSSRAPDFVFVLPDGTPNENLETVRETMRAFRLSRSQQADTTDARRRVDAALRELATFYNGQKLEVPEHFELCKTLTSVQRQSQRAVYEAGIEHCEAVRKILNGTVSNVRFLQALSTMAESQFRFGDYEAAKATFTLYLEIACNDAPPDEDTRSKRYRTAFCERTLTHYLPIIYHKLGDLEALTASRDKLTEQGFTEARQLRTLHILLIEDLWRGPTLEPLKELCATLEKSATTSSSLRDVLPRVLSTRARLGMLSGDCYAGRRVYLDHDWNHPSERERYSSWNRVHVAAPQRLLCYTAPPIMSKEWIGDRAPSVLPGGDQPLEKPVLIHFFKPAGSILDEHGPAMAKLARQHGDSVQFVGIVPRASFCYDVAGEASVSGLDAVTFRRALATFLEAVGIQYPVGLIGSVDDSNAEQYGVISYPTLVLVDKSNTIVAYHTSAGVDAGWDRCLEDVTKP